MSYSIHKLTLLAASLATVALGAEAPLLAEEASSSSAVMLAADVSPSHASLQPAAELAGLRMSAAAPAPLAAKPAFHGITKLHAHQVGDRPAVTLYVRNIPVVTFLATNPDTTAGALERATNTAREIDRRYTAGLDAQAIRYEWSNRDKRYWVTVAGEPLVAIDRETLAPLPTESYSADAVQVANRLRRQLGNAQPLAYNGQLRMRDGSLPGASDETNLQHNGVAYAVRSSSSGMASWYGPGFHGRRTANGERFNQNAMTAAHRTLPFGTLVRVTNVENGQSAIVRINDRGPFIRGRIIDLSVGAARAIDMYSDGVASVRLEVLQPVSGPTTVADRS